MVFGMNFMEGFGRMAFLRCVWKALFITFLSFLGQIVILLMGQMVKKKKNLKRWVYIAIQGCLFRTTPLYVQKEELASSDYQSSQSGLVARQHFLMNFSPVHTSISLPTCARVRFHINRAYIMCPCHLTITKNKTQKD